ncbi:MAG: hypothetical protein GXO79_06910 [Chlorobi bacterium]|nr:hypothetical protein [Chlorobiota bacterium]
MSRYLGLDLGTNSIGWEYIDLTRTEKRLLRRKYQREIILQSKITKKEATLFKIKNYLKTNIRILILSSITMTLFLLTMFFVQYWQVFLTLGIGGLISVLTFENKKNK